MVALGVVLVVVALLLGLAEAHLSSGGLIACGAATALLAGIVLLALEAGVALPAVIGIGAVGFAASSGGVLLLARTARLARRARPRAGIEAMVGRVGTVRTAGGSPRVFVDGSLWRAQPSPLERERELRDGERVVVENVRGLTLSVRKADELELEPWS